MLSSLKMFLVKLPVILLAVFISLFVSTQESSSEPQNSVKAERFEVLYEQNSNPLISCLIVRDKKTGVQYLFFKYGHGAAMTPLVGEDDTVDEKKIPGNQPVATLGSSG
jgi:hypothetical protein